MAVPRSSTLNTRCGNALHSSCPTVFVYVFRASCSNQPGGARHGIMISAGHPICSESVVGKISAHLSPVEQPCNRASIYVRTTCLRWYAVGCIGQPSRASRSLQYLFQTRWRGLCGSVDQTYVHISPSYASQGLQKVKVGTRDVEYNQQLAL